MPWVKTCCCGCKLKTGCIIIGVLTILNSLAWVGGAINRRTTEDWVVISAIFSAMDLVFAIILIIGAVKAKKWLLVPIMIGYLIDYVIYLTLVILVATSIFVTETARWAQVVAWIIASIVKTYFLIVFYSHFQELKERGL